MRIIFVALVSILFSQPVFAWEQVPIAHCYKALEKGVVLHDFWTGERDSWHDPRKRHFHVFTNQSIYDFYYKVGQDYTKYSDTRRAYCEVIRFVDYDCSGDFKRSC